MNDTLHSYQAVDQLLPQHATSEKTRECNARSRVHHGRSIALLVLLLLPLPCNPGRRRISKHRPPRPGYWLGEALCPIAPSQHNRSGEAQNPRWLVGRNLGALDPPSARGRAAPGSRGGYRRATIDGVITSTEGPTRRYRPFCRSVSHSVYRSVQKSVGPSA